MKILLIVCLISLSLATLASKPAEKKSTNTAPVSAKDSKENTASGKTTKEADCETTEELKKKIAQKPAAALPKTEAAVKNDGFSLQGNSTGCSL